MGDKNYKKRNCFYLFFLVLFLSSFFLSDNKLCQAQEQVTITTYYPAPYGVYRELRANQMAIGSTYRAAGLADGNLIVSGNVAIGQASTFGRFIINMNNNNDYFAVNNDANVGLELRSGTSGGFPYIDMSRDLTDFDFRLWLLGTDTLDMRGGVVRFSDNAGAPAVIRVSEVWYCTSYADIYP